MELLGEGAEAKIYLDKDCVVKSRPVKKYRIPILDIKIRKSRNRREVKILQKLHSLDISVPSIIDADTFSYRMEFIDGKKVRDCLDEDFESITAQIGKGISELHRYDIVHGDLTTSNLLYKEGIVYFIDFGLSVISKRVEDKAVDLHLLKQALESYHYTNWEKAFDNIIESYAQHYPDSADILKRFTIVEKRGRNKH